jgi:hypothetical protein
MGKIARATNQPYARQGEKPSGDTNPMDPRLPASRTVRKEISLLKPASLGYFVTKALKNNTVKQLKHRSTTARKRRVLQPGCQGHKPCSGPGTKGTHLAVRQNKGRCVWGLFTYLIL